MIQSRNPATGVLLRSFEPLTPEGIEARLALAADAARSFPAVGLEQRAFWMRRLALLLESESEDLAALITAEVGKTLVSARAEVAKCALTCRFYSERAAEMLAPEPASGSYPESFIRYDPIGIVLAIMPWNFPLWQVFRFLAPSLMAGNVGLLKHAPNVPQCALAIEALVRRAGFPRGTFQSLLLEDTQVETLIADPRIAAITLTGSEAAGRAVAAQAGWFLKKTVLELGGSDAFIVLASADLDAAVTNAVAARCLNNGQSCIAAKRFLIHESLYEDFVRRFTTAMAAQRVGDPLDPATDIGPLALPRLKQALLAQVDAAIAAGGRVLTGVRGPGAPAQTGTGNYFPPTVIAGVPRSAPVCQEETFGPLALVFAITSLDDAIRLANDTPFGLGASAWTSDPDEQRRLAAELQCGAVFFNAPVASDPRLPFGGVKNSGYGRELSTAGMREFLNAKTVVVAGPTRALVPQPALLDKSQLKSRVARPPTPTPAPLPPPPVPAPLPAVATPHAQPVAAAPQPSASAAQPQDVIQSLPSLASPQPSALPERTGQSPVPRDSQPVRSDPRPDSAPQLKPLYTGEFRLPPVAPRPLPPLNPRAVQLKPLDTGDYRLQPLDGQASDLYDDQDDDPTSATGSILGLRR
jgi:succinate-semialdehyde dehydrogenase/glutarate-semialdehyde dehydrogenase